MGLEEHLALHEPGSTRLRAGPRGALPALAVTVALFLALVAGLAYTMEVFTLQFAVAAGLCVALSFLCFAQVKLVLYVLIFACLFSPELQIGTVLGRASKRPVTIRVEDILLVVIVITWFARAAVSKELGLMLRTPLNRPILAYALLCVLATLLGFGYGWVEPSFGPPLFVLKYIQYFVLFFVVVNYIETPRDLRRLVAAGVVTYAVVIVYGLVQVPAGLRPSTFAEHPAEPNTLAGYLLLMMGVCSGFLISARTTVRRLGWAALLVPGFVLLVYTLSRSGWAGLAGIAAALLVLSRQRVAVLGALLVLAAALALFSFKTEWVPKPVEDRVRQTLGDYETYPGMPPPARFLGMELDPSASERYRSYRDALRTWWDRSTEHWVPALTGSGVLGGRPFVDGQYVRVLTESGLLGLAAFVALLVAIWRHVWRSYHELESPWYRGLALGYLAGFAGLLIHALAANTFIIVRIMEPFFIFTGVVMLLPHMERLERQEPGAAAEAPYEQT
ncbi:MAG: O-antigen ligase family protein [Planctomycetota bacterium]